MELICSFLGLLLGSADVEKWGDHLEKKFIVDNVIQALIPFKKGIGAYRSCMYIWGSEFQFGKKGIIFEVEK